MSKVLSKEELYSRKGQRWFDDNCSEAAFLLGGIGTGNVSVGTRGQLKDWEIFGTSGKGNYMPYTFFAIWTKEEGGEPRAKVLESRLKPPFLKSNGFEDYDVAGIPRFERSRLKGEYPFVWVELKDKNMPVSVTMEAFTPFIPLNADDSGIPTGIIRYYVKNTADKPLKVSIAGSLANFSSLKAYEHHTWKWYELADEGVNEYKDDGAVRGLYLRPKTLTESSIYYGTIALTTRAKNISYKRAWLNGGWFDGLQDMWDDFRTDGRLEAESVYTAKDVQKNGPDLVGSLAIHEELKPGEEKVFEFLLTWHFPNRVNCWSKRMYDEAVRPGKEKSADSKASADCGCDQATSDCCCDPADANSCCDSASAESCCEQTDSGSCCSSSASSCCNSEIDKTGGYPVIKKYYAAIFKDAWDVAHYTAVNMARLEDTSRKFHDAFFSSTLPDYVLEAVSANITALRSNTCFRLADGTLMAWEGCFDDDGCCAGNCTHVWNYAQTIAFLFPELEQSMRRVDYKIETRPNGKMNFRSYQVFGMGAHDQPPAADGQLGTLVRLYREWKFSGDNDFLKDLWPIAKMSLDFAFDCWDKDKDLVLDTNQDNTYDIAFQGPSSMINSIFFAALKAGAEISEFLGDKESAGKYRKAFEEGSVKMDEMLWGGEYYIQRIDDVDEYRYQYGSGCLSDQIFGQTLAHIVNLGYVLPKEHVKKAVKSIFDYNFLQSAEEHHNTQRTFMLNDESGLLLCTWPHGGRPRFPFPYSDEVWTGIEYQVAANLIYEGYIDEALTIVKSVRDRHDGIRRNPWNEVECGHHYARSMASYGVLTALCGFKYDLPGGWISFDPKINKDNFRCFFSTGKCWGVYTCRKNPDGTYAEDVEVLYGSMDGIKLI